MAGTQKATRTTHGKAAAAAKNKPTVDSQNGNAIDKQDARDAEIEQLKAQLKDLMKQISAANSTGTQIVNVVQDTEKVILRWQAEVADDNTEIFGANGMYGQVTGKTGKVIVPKSEWSRFYTDSIRWRIDNRWLIVLSGLTDEEREIYHCNYKPGEVLDEQAFAKLVDMGEDLLEIFPDLCIANQEFVAQRFIQAWSDGRITSADRPLVTKLNDMSKEAYAKANIPAADRRRKGAFLPIIEQMNAQDTQ